LLPHASAWGYFFKMALPQFYHKGIFTKGEELWLDEDTVRHVLQVLRMQAGDKIGLTNGEGYAAVAVITKTEKRKCGIVLENIHFYEPRKCHLHLAVAFTKNSSRNEWLLEKATELGVSTIIPISAERSEKEKTRYGRWNSILVSALLQSQQYYLPMLLEMTDIKTLTGTYIGVQQKLIGHCIEQNERRPLAEMLKPGCDTILLIGPEGDFSQEEVNLCTENGFKGVSFGWQRLRTETAAMAACAYFNLVNI